MRIAAACAVLVVAFVAALMVGRSGGDSSGEKIDTPASVKAIELPEGSTQAPKLVNAGNVPDLRKTPEAPATSGTNTSGSSPTTSSSPSTGSTPSSGGGGGSTGGGSEPTAPPPG